MKKRISKDFLRVLEIIMVVGYILTSFVDYIITERLLDKYFNVGLIFGYISIVFLIGFILIAGIQLFSNLTSRSIEEDELTKGLENKAGYYTLLVVLMLLIVLNFIAMENGGRVTLRDNFFLYVIFGAIAVKNGIYLFLDKKDLY